MIERCLARKNAPHTHGYVRKLREHSVDEVPQFLQQPLANLDSLAGNGG
jgi:hypothetical protein